MNNKESVTRTLAVALVVSLISAIFVAGTAIGLKPVQMENRQTDVQRSILQIAHLLPEGVVSDTEVKRIFKTRIEAKAVDLTTGAYRDDINTQTFNAVQTARDPANSRALSAAEDLAGIKRRENISVVYRVINGEGKTESLILPVRGYGLWSTLFGFLALKADLNTVIGLGFYQHSETPGLGGEVDNPRWKAKWPGKTLFDTNGKPIIQVVKGGVREGSPDAGHQVDALSGASLTSRGVDHLLNFWLGEQGFGTYLARLRREGV